MSTDEEGEKNFARLCEKIMMAGSSLRFSSYSSFTSFKNKSYSHAGCRRERDAL